MRRHAEGASGKGVSAGGGVRDGRPGSPPGSGNNGDEVPLRDGVQQPFCSPSRRRISRLSPVAFWTRTESCTVVSPECVTSRSARSSPQPRMTFGGQDLYPLLAPGRRFLCDPLFDEAGIPSSIRLRLALAPRHWSLLARVVWFCGWSHGAESLREARGRAHRAAERLGELAREHGSVMLVGHGVMNRLISRALRRSGWRGSASGFAFWSVIALQRAA